MDRSPPHLPSRLPEPGGRRAGRAPLIRFFDTSALGAVFVGQGGQQWVHELLYRRPGLAMVSELADVEIVSVLSRSRHAITSSATKSSKASSVGTTSRPTATGRSASTVSRRRPMPSPGRSSSTRSSVPSTAVHLAAALQVHRQDPDRQPVTFVTLDRRQAVAGRRLGLTVVDGPTA